MTDSIDGAFDAIDSGILPGIATLLDGVIETATLARPGHDCADHAAALHRLAGETAALQRALAAFLPQPEVAAIPESPPLKISA